MARPRGSHNFNKGEASAAAGKLLESPEYQESLLRRMKNDTLPQALEVLLWHYRYGRPVESIHVETNVTTDLSNTSTAELSVRAELLAKKLKERAGMHTTAGAPN